MGVLLGTMALCRNADWADRNFLTACERDDACIIFHKVRNGSLAPCGNSIELNGESITVGGLAGIAGSGYSCPSLLLWFENGKFDEEVVN